MLRNQKGFTLIEIIAVLIILGILAAVAIPKYFDLTAEAKNKAAVGAVAEGKAMLNLAWGKAALSAGGSVSSTPLVTAALGATSTTAGDFGVSFNASGTGAILVSASGAAGGAAAGGTASGIWTLP